MSLRKYFQFTYLYASSSVSDEQQRGRKEQVEEIEEGEP